MAEAAQRLDVNVQRVHQRIADGSLAAERIGNQWIIDEADVQRMDRRHAGRPLSSRSAWALAMAAASERNSFSRPAAPWQISAPERSRARSRLRQLLSDASSAASSEELAAVVRAVMKNRARRLMFRSSPRDLVDLRADERVQPSGVSLRASDIAAADIVEGYTTERDLDGLVNDFLLVEARHDNANVILHVVENEVPFRALADFGGWLLLAADLAEYHRPRESSRAAELVRAAARQEAAGPMDRQGADR